MAADVLSYAHNNSGDKKMTLNDIKIICTRLNYGFGHKNPVDSVKFFKKGNIKGYFY